MEKIHRGIYVGVKDFKMFFDTLESKFKDFGLKLTHEVSKKKLVLLDIEIYIDDDKFHTKEHRKETASSTYIKFGSSHPSHSFKGIIKSQMYRLRRLCSRDSDFISSIKDLEIRCINSGYDKRIIDGILNQSGNLTRSLVKRDRTVDNSHVRTIKWVILSGTYYEKATMNFTKNLNELLSNHDIKFEVVRSTGSNLGRLLYNNREKYEENCREKNCNICTNGNRSSDFEVHSKITSSKYAIDKNINCSNSGIYRITCPCSSAYTGKTTIFNQRFKPTAS